MTRYEELLLEAPASFCIVAGIVTSIMAYAIASQPLNLPGSHA